MPSIPACVIESRLDYITVTCTDAAEMPGFSQLGWMLLASAKADGGREVPFRLKGYEGQHAGWCSYGTRMDSSIIQVSGAKADDWFDILFVNADHVTRLDLCVTVRFEEEDGGVAERARSECEAWKAQTGRTLDCTGLQKNGYVNTTYFGQRVSDIFGRVYDKYLESSDASYLRCWRYEIETKGVVAYRTAQHLHSGGDRQRRILSAVHRYFANRGVAVPFDRTDADMRLQSVRAPSDAVSRLKWLSESVKPAVQWLIGQGMTDQVCEAIGLPRSVSERYRLSGLLEQDHHRNELEEGEE